MSADKDVEQQVAADELTTEDLDAVEQAEIAQARSLMTDEELEALEIDLSDDGDEDEGDDEDDGPEAAEVDDEPTDEPEAADVESADEPGDEDEPEAKEEPAQVELPKAEQPELPRVIEVPEEVQQQREELETKYTELEERYEAGEITTAEHMRQLRELTRAEARLDMEEQRAQWSREEHEHATQALQQREAQAWESAIAQLLDELDAAGVEDLPDYRNDDQRGYELGTQASAILAARGQPENTVVADKMDVLRQAQREVYYRATGKAWPTAPAEETKPDPKAIKKAAADKRKPDLSKVPAPLSQMPGTGGDDGEAAEFANIMELEGEAFEAATRRMAQRDPAKYERFLAEA